jgi:hypothetical protein
MKDINPIFVKNKRLKGFFRHWYITRDSCYWQAPYAKALILRTKDFEFLSVTWDDYSYVIDCGPDFRQMLASNCQK